MERILVVDDEVQVCAVLKEFLNLRNFEVHTAHDGPTAISKVKEIRPHIVLLDIIMPGMGGIDVLKEIKKIDPTVGVIMVTGVTNNEVAKRTLELGAYDYITKPMDLNYFETVVMVMIIDLLG
jgi:two-component system NtrC family response regulator